MNIKRRTFLKRATTSTFGMFTASKVFAGIFINNETDAAEIEKVYIIFITHLDVGFTNLADTAQQTILG